MKIYTRTGDTGDTGLYGGQRVPKDDRRIAAYGTVDELNAALGVARACPAVAQLEPILFRIQNELFAVGAELATPDPAAHGLDLIGDLNIYPLETAIDELETHLTPLRQFVLPGGSPLAAALHMARTICRRAERDLVHLSRSGPTVRVELLQYLNRLGDLLFVMARFANQATGGADVPWNGCRPT